MFLNHTRFLVIFDCVCFCFMRASSTTGKSFWLLVPLARCHPGKFEMSLHKQAIGRRKTCDFVCAHESITMIFDRKIVVISVT